MSSCGHILCVESMRLDDFSFRECHPVHCRLLSCYFDLYLFYLFFEIEEKILGYINATNRR